uniref:Phorbol-ester/DAG-type domain-containing protein n=1 Tax=Timema douglasi TaxID=61478 RepID=A0A7R8Z6L2_TIMDO|nr:unnamed protein product [Timema douglasi]
MPPHLIEKELKTSKFTALDWLIHVVLTQATDLTDILNHTSRSRMWPLFIMWNAGLVNVVLPTITVATLFIVAVSLIRYITADTHIPIRDATKQHNWHSVKRLTETCYCSVCESLMMTGEGLYCDCCGVCADRGCIRAADRKFRCKVISCSDKGRWKHHWVKGKWM